MAAPLQQVVSVETKKKKKISHNQMLKTTACIWTKRKCILHIKNALIFMKTEEKEKKTSCSVPVLLLLQPVLLCEEHMSRFDHWKQHVGAAHSDTLPLRHLQGKLNSFRVTFSMAC